MNYLAGPRHDHDLEDHSECLHGLLEWLGFQDTEGDDSGEPPPAPPKHGVAVGCGVHPQLSPNFALSEMSRSNTAMAKGIPNNPPCEAQKNLAAVVNAVLQNVRNRYGPVTVTSAYRSPALNKEVGGTNNSQHTKGEAIDFKVYGKDHLEIAKWIAQNLTFDQLILEHYDVPGSHTGWIHVSFKRNGPNRGQVLTKRSKKLGGGYHDGLVPFPDMGDPLKETVRDVVDKPLNWVGIGAVAAGLGALWFMRKKKRGRR
jgi:zinc D-Ala-D-Ala carboxypeptidase